MFTSAELYQRAKHSIPGGVNSPVRAFKGVGGDPVFFQRGEGPYAYDSQGNKYIDYVGSWGPLILGHAHPAVINAVQTTASKGLSFGAPTELEIELAELICKLMPNIEMVRMVNSGTEATMTAIRLARGFTKRDKIIKFTGCYHGHSDSLLVKAGSGLLTLGIADSAGVPADFVKHTVIAEFNNLEQVSDLFKNFGDDIAAVIVEPIPCNMNCVLPEPQFLAGLRSLCDQHASLLIFDEVITGFRVGLGGAQDYFKVKPDLTTLGKIIGGGMPVGAFGGRKEVMEYLAPLGPVYQAGTLSGNPVAMAAGIATLQEISKPNFYSTLFANTENLVGSLQAIAQQNNIAFTTNHLGGIFGIFFTPEKNINTYEKVAACDLNLFKQFFHAMLAEGIYLAPSMYEVGFMSSAHGEKEIAMTLEAAERVFRKLP